MRRGDSAEVSTDGLVSISSMAAALHDNEEMGQLSQGPVGLCLTLSGVPEFRSMWEGRSHPRPASCSPPCLDTLSGPGGKDSPASGPERHLSSAVALQDTQVDDMMTSNWAQLVCEGY